MTTSRDLEWLQTSLRALDRVYFSDTLHDVRVGWMRWRPSPHGFTWGRCYVPERVIHLNRALAHAWVPDHVVLGVLYHEALHLVIGEQHDTAFQLAEQRFAHHGEMRAWEVEHLPALLKAENPHARRTVSNR